MHCRYLLSLFLISATLAAEEAQKNDLSEEVNDDKQEGESAIDVKPHPLRVEFSKANDENKTPSQKKVKPHFAGVRRKEPKEESAEGEKKKSSKVKNQWVSSKTHPKTKKKEQEQPSIEPVAELPENRPYFRRADYRAATPMTVDHRSSVATSIPSQHLEEKIHDDITEGMEFPRQGFEGPMSHVYLTGEWLYWRLRQEGMEFAPSKRVRFDFDSGFRAGLGVHLPHDGWDLYVNYTRYTTEAEEGAHGSFFPLMLYAATNNVLEAHIEWNFKFQTADLEIGRVFYIGKTLILRPFFGVKGAWIDQNSHLRYAGGIIPAGQHDRIHLQNDFRGGGPLLGVQTRWDLGVGISFFGNGAAALVIGEFNNHQRQIQAGGFVPINLNTNIRLMTSTLQLVTGLGWDRNLCNDRCHVGISAGFEAQMWNSQNQIEQFTTPAQPYYVRNQGDLSLYGLTLRARVDF